MGTVAAIIAEYNPFHSGHLYHLEKTRELTKADTVIAVMSGDFVQRGEPALFDKRVRAEAAVLNGIDLVLELPFVYACNTAEYFAKGAVRLLNGLGCVDVLSFGSENGNIEELHKVASFLAENSESYSEVLKAEMSGGASYPKAVEKAVASLLGEKESKILRQPNNILAVEYVKQLIRTSSNIIPITVKRYAANISGISQSSGIAGATAIRNMFFSDDFSNYNIRDFIPEKTVDCLERHESAGAKPVSINDFFPWIICSVISERNNAFGLSDILAAGEGLENRLIDAARQADTMDKLIRLTKTRRYPETRIKRLIIQTLLGLTKEKMERCDRQGSYARILAMNETGSAFVNRAKKSKRRTSPILSNINKQQDQIAGYEDILSFDLLASDFYRLATRGALAGYRDDKQYPIIL